MPEVWCKYEMCGPKAFWIPNLPQACGKFRP
jgi:hypothetical protein